MLQIAHDVLNACMVMSDAEVISDVVILAFATVTQSLKDFVSIRKGLPCGVVRHGRSVACLICNICCWEWIQ